MRRNDIYWKKLGSATKAPFVLHHGDSKVPGSDEKITITNLDKHDYIGFFVYSAIGNGAGSLRSYGAKVIVSDGNGQSITVPLYNDQESYWCSVAVADFT